MFGAYRRLWFVGHLAFVFFLSLIWLARHKSLLFFDLDGSYIRLLIREYGMWVPFGLNLPLTIHQGMGASFFPTHFSLLPAIALQQLIAGPDIFPVVANALFAVELFIAGYLWARVFQLSQRVALISAWALILLALPFLAKPYLNAVFLLVPHAADAMLCQSLFVYCAFHIVSARNWRSILSMAAVVVIPFYFIGVHPAGAILYVPPMAAMAIVSIVAAPHTGARVLRMAAFIASSMVLWMAGLIDFEIGNTSFSVGSFFASELENFQGSLFDASILFQWQVYPAGPILVALAVAGGIVALICERGAARRFAALHLLATALLVGGSALVVMFITNWRGPPGEYLERLYWPGYMAYASYGILKAGEWALLAIRPLYKPTMSLLGRTTTLPVLAFPVAIWVMVLAGPKPGYSERYPPHSTPIVDVLRADLAISLGDPFRGYAATFTGLTGANKRRDWLGQHTFDQLTLMPAFRNDHRLVGLWYFNIPTLSTYTPYATPHYYLFMSRLLATSDIKQIRHVLSLSHVNIPVLRAIGVRYVVSDHIVSGDATLRAVLPVPGGTELRLYELPQPNLATYSPRVIRPVEAAAEMIQIMQGAFDFETDVVVSGFDARGPLASIMGQQLNRLDSARMTADRDGIRIVASAGGLASVLIPIQYSRCLRPVFNGEAPGDFGIYRANLVETLMTFRGQVDVTLQIQNGPFGASHCRIEDFEEAKALGIGR